MEQVTRMKKYGTLVFFSGKMGSGKTTTAIEVARNMNAILISEDEWLANLYPEEITRFDDYIKYSSRLKPVIKSHVQNILSAGISVVMDFPGNTKNQRAWFKEILKGNTFPHKLFYLQADDNVCLHRLTLRQQVQPERANFDTEAVFNQVTAYFQAPALEEGFTVEIIRQENT